VGWGGGGGGGGGGDEGKTVLTTGYNFSAFELSKRLWNYEY
jgi:hypothetical protein